MKCDTRCQFLCSAAECESILWRLSHQPWRLHLFSGCMWSSGFLLIPVVVSGARLRICAILDSMLTLTAPSGHGYQGKVYMQCPNEAPANPWPAVCCAVAWQNPAAEIHKDFTDALPHADAVIRETQEHLWLLFPTLTPHSDLGNSEG